MSYDFAGFNPLRDVDRKSEQISVNILAQLITAIKLKTTSEPTERKY